MHVRLTLATPTQPDSRDVQPARRELGLLEGRRASVFPIPLREQCRFSADGTEACLHTARLSRHKIAWCSLLPSCRWQAPSSASRSKPGPHRRHQLRGLSSSLSIRRCQVATRRSIPPRLRRCASHASTVASDVLPNWPRSCLRADGFLHRLNKRFSGLEEATSGGCPTFR